MDTTAYYALLVPAFLLLIGLEAVVAKWRGRPVLSFANSIGNLSAGIGALYVGLFVGPVLVALYVWSYQHIAVIHWQEGSLWPWVLGLLLADFAHYVQHWVDHRVAPLWGFHGVHHQGTEVNLTLSMRHTWGSDFYSFPFYFALPLCGVPPTVFFICTTIMSVHAMATHSSELRFPSFGILVTPQSHALHHAKNRCYIDTNYGGLFCIWDKLFGTHAYERPDEPPVYGIPRGYGTHSGVLCHWQQMADFVTSWRQWRGWRARLRALILPPEVMPPNYRLPPLPTVPASRDLALATRLYVLAQFAATGTFAVAILLNRAQIGMGDRILSAAFVLAALFCLGALLDAKPRARQWEAWRLALCLPLLAGRFLI